MIRIRYRTRSALVILRIVFPILAVVFLLIGFLLLAQSTSFLKRATASAQGVIIACDYSRSSNRRISSACKPHIQFVTQDGRTTEVVSSITSSTYRVGQQVTVAYDPNHPQDAQISSFFESWGFPLLFLGIGGVFTILTLTVRLRSKRFERITT